MPGRPNLFNDIAVAANKKNNTKHCHVFLGAENLDESTMRVVVERTDGLGIDVKQVSVVPGRTTPQVLIIRTKQVPPRFRDTEEITVTVTDTGGSAQADVDVVYYEEQLDRALPLKPAAATRTKTAKKTKKPKLQQKKTSSKTKK